MNNKQIKEKIVEALEDDPDKTLSGCGCKQGEEVDGWEFDVNNLEEFMEVIKTYGSIHLNFYGDDNVDIWMSKERK